MKLRELLQEMKKVQEKISTSEPYICGGTPRDRYMKRLDNISDLDITTGDKTVQYLAQEFGTVLGKKYNVTYRSHDDGHASVFIGSFKMDFSSNFNAPNIISILKSKGITNPTEMQKEMFSRDFTCNSLLLSINLKNVIDPTKQGFKDINSKIIRTCLDPEITLTTNKNRVIRAIYLASKLDFDIDQKIIDYVKLNPQSVKIASDKVLSEKLNEAFNRNPERATYYLNKMNLWDQIPITEVVRPYYMKNVNAPQKVAYFQGGGGVNEPTPKEKKYKSDKAIVVQPRFKEPFYRNYDLYDVPGEHGPGAGWNTMQNYKSVSEFLETKRKKLKDKYKADDSWIQPNGKIKKENKINIRKNLLIKLADIDLDYNAIDFPVDDYESYSDPNVTSLEGGVPEGNNPVGEANDIGGYLDEYLTQNDFEGKSPDSLDFGRDYTEDSEPLIEDDVLKELMEKYLTPAPNHGLYGLPDGVDLPDEDLGQPTDLNPDYGTLGPESLIYEDKWNI
jgi:tRNA nucleotidyltransferase/poly(A) polymerase